MVGTSETVVLWIVVLVVLTNHTAAQLSIFFVHGSSGVTVTKSDRGTTSYLDLVYFYSHIKPADSDGLGWQAWGFGLWRVQPVLEALRG